MRLSLIGMWLTASFLILATDVTGQPAGDSETLRSRVDFSWIEVTTGAGHGQAVRGYDGWTPGAEPHMMFSTPYLGGRAEFRFSYRSWAADRAGLPSFFALFGSLGWAPDIRVGPRFSFLPGIRAGNHLMSFRTDQLVGQRIESEFAIEPFLRLSAHLTERLALGVEGAALRVFTTPRLDHASIRAGLSWRFGAPDGLRAFLR